VIEATATDFGNSSVKMPFWDVIRFMSSKNALYDVLMMPDGELREDDFTAEKLAPYPMVIVPDAPVLTKNQQEILLAYAQKGGRVLIYGRLAEGSDLADSLKAYENVTFAADGMENFEPVFAEEYAGVSSAVCTDPRMGMHRYDADGRTFVHLLNYDYDKEEDRIRPIEEAEVTLRETASKEVKVWSLDGEVPAGEFEVVRREKEISVKLFNVGVYRVIEI
jgi:hypothetical protein